MEERKGGRAEEDGLHVNNEHIIKKISSSYMLEMHSQVTIIPWIECRNLILDGLLKLKE